MSRTRAAALAAVLLVAFTGQAWADLCTDAAQAEKFVKMMTDWATSCTACEVDWKSCCTGACASGYKTYVDTIKAYATQCAQIDAKIYDDGLAEFNAACTGSAGPNPSTTPATNNPTPSIAPVVSSPPPPPSLIAQPLIACSVGGDPHIRTNYGGVNAFVTCNDTGVLTLADNLLYTITAVAEAIAPVDGAPGASIITSLTITPKDLLVKNGLLLASRTVAAGEEFSVAALRAYVKVEGGDYAGKKFLWVTMVIPNTGSGLCYNPNACVNKVAVQSVNATTLPGGRHLLQTRYSNATLTACIATGLTGDVLNACAYDYQATNTPAFVTLAASANAKYTQAVKDSNPSLAGSVARAGYLGVLMALGAALLTML